MGLVSLNLVGELCGCFIHLYFTDLATNFPLYFLPLSILLIFALSIHFHCFSHPQHLPKLSLPPHFLELVYLTQLLSKPITLTRSSYVISSISSFQVVKLPLCFPLQALSRSLSSI